MTITILIKLPDDTNKKVERLNVCEKKSIQEKIQVLMTYIILEKPKTKEAKILQIGKVRFLKELAKEVGPAIGKYAQYEYKYDLEYAQNTDESIERICNKWEKLDAEELDMSGGEYTPNE